MKSHKMFEYTMCKDFNTNVFFQDGVPVDEFGLPQVPAT